MPIARVGSKVVLGPRQPWGGYLTEITAGFKTLTYKRGDTELRPAHYVQTFTITYNEVVYDSVIGHDVNSYEDTVYDLDRLFETVLVGLLMDVVHPVLNKELET